MLLLHRPVLLLLLLHLLQLHRVGATQSVLEEEQSAHLPQPPQSTGAHLLQGAVFTSQQTTLQPSATTWKLSVYVPGRTVAEAEEKDTCIVL